MTSHKVLIAITFVISVNALTEPDFNLIIPKECEGKSFCEVEPENYPHIYFNDYTRAMQNKGFMSSVPYDDIPPTQIISDEQNCDMEVSVIRPYSLQTSNKSVKLVVQSKYFEQRVTQTRCKSRGASCFESMKMMGFANVCRETYADIQLYLFDPTDGQIKHELVSIPVCCSCSIHREMK